MVENFIEVQLASTCSSLCWSERDRPIQQKQKKNREGLNTKQDNAISGHIDDQYQHTCFILNRLHLILSTKINEVLERQLWEMSDLKCVRI